MTEPSSYTHRRGRFAAERSYRIAPDALAWTENGRERRLAFADIAALEVFLARIPGVPGAYWTCLLHRKDGGREKISAAHWTGLRSVEDRSKSYFPFVHALTARIQEANPQVGSIEHRSIRDRIDTAVGSTGVGALRLLRKLDLERGAGFAGAAMRRIGPRLRGHRTADEQLATVFPDMSKAEREKVLAGMWDNFGRLFVEYAHLDRLWDYDWDDPKPGGRIEMDAASAERLKAACRGGGRAMFFTGHIANWEITPLGATTLGREIAVVFRAPRIGAFTKEMVKQRSALGSTVISAGPDTPLRIREALKSGKMVGMLVDQHYVRGIDVDFFGRRCKVNPMLGRFARMFDCPIYGARAIRLPDERFRFELVGPLDVPRDAEGKIEVDGTMQMVTDVIEGWVRDHPEQWLWLHRRWR